MRGAALLLLATLLTPVAWAANVTVNVAVVSLAGDARYAPRRLEKAYPGHPAGRPWAAAQLGADDAQVELDTAGISLKLIDAVLPGPSLCDYSSLSHALSQKGLPKDVIYLV